MTKVHHAILTVTILYATALVPNGVVLAAEEASPAQSGATPVERHQAHGLEGRIEELHSKLHITKAQENEWKALAQTMRENTEAMRTVILEKRRDVEKSNAINDLDLYRKVAETHLQNVIRLKAAFERLYNGMSEEQKRVADEVFRSHGGQDARPSAARPEAGR